MSLKKIVLDSYAVIAYLEQEKGSHEVVRYLEQAKKKGCELLLNLVNWGEIYYSVFRSKGEVSAQECLLLIDQLPIQLIDVDRDLIHSAAKLKARYPLTYADCFAAALAKKEKCPVLTGDKEFSKLEGEVNISWLT